MTTESHFFFSLGAYYQFCVAYTTCVATLCHERIYLFIFRVERLSRGLVSHTCTHCGPIFITWRRVASGETNGFLLGKKAHAAPRRMKSLPPPQRFRRTGVKWKCTLVTSYPQPPSYRPTRSEQHESGRSGGER